MIVSLLIMLGLIVGFTIFYTYAYPFLFSPAMLPWALFITFTIVNAIAIILSWVYFDQTKCYQDEGNPFAMILYYLYGHTIGHILLIIFRVFVNVGFYFSVFGLDLNIIGIDITVLPQNNLILAIPTSVFTTELLFNIYAISNHWDDKCKPPKPLICLDPNGCDVDV